MPRRTKTGPLQARKAINSSRIERWLGVEKTQNLVRSMHGWYGPPLNLIDVPGSVWIDGEGHFSGLFYRGFMDSAYDALECYWRRLWNASRMPVYGQCNAGFASISDALNKASTGYQQEIPPGGIVKNGAAGTLQTTQTAWRVGAQPAGGAAGAAAPGGTAHTKANTGAMFFSNPATGTLHLVGADMLASVINNSVMVCDRLFSVAKTMSSTTTEAVTGVPSRYQSTVETNDDYVGGNFLTIEVGALLGATAHNWTTCLYTDNAGATGVALPSVTGISAAGQDRLDMTAGGWWFAPLAAGGVGIKALTQMQCSASVTGAVNFVINRNIGILQFPVANSMLPFDWLTNRKLAPRIFNDACLYLLELNKPATTATTYTGQLYALNAP